MHARSPLRVPIVVCTGLILGSVTFLPTAAQSAESAVHYYVAPSGSDDNAGVQPSEPFETIQHALDLALPGDTVHLGSGTYKQDVVTVRGGDSTTAPITIAGPKDAVVKGGGNGRIVEVNHSYIVLQGFTIDGKFDSGDRKSAYRDKLIYAISKKANVGITGLKVLGMTLQNAGGECVRLRYFASKNVVAGNTITDCGIYDFRFNGGGKNGEAVYIGTAPEQWGANGAPTNDPDKSDKNWVHHNDIKTNGNECVDIKESSSGNVVEHNDCSGQKDVNSAGLNSRGSGNIFRYNTIHDNLGAGIRFGGDKSTDGTDNDAYGNTITNNEVGGIKFMAKPQGKVCGNTFSGNGGADAVGTYRDDFEPAEPCDGDNPQVVDTEKPSTPTDLTATAIDATTVKLTWDASTDNVKVTGYEVVRDDVLVGSTETPGFDDTTVSPDTTYDYTVRAVDAAGNTSPESAALRVTTPPGPPPGSISEDFESPSAAERFEVISGGRWRVENGVYRLTRPGSKRKANGNVSVHVTPVSGDFSLTAEAQVKGTSIRTNDFSVIFGYRNLKNYCYASFSETNDGRTSALFRVRDGAVTELDDITKVIDADRFYTVGIEVDDDDVRVTLGGQEVATATTSGCGDGQVGFGSANDAGQFDNLLVQPITSTGVVTAQEQGG
ncbi:MAG: right-handed parallel beta-helix repeat-containing protein [Actinobacteria bacterium]|nr:right-handed parallel beta-helix repeat-containing protein [Actinomycetota bacterium]